jgi:hypothetical protein
MLVALRNVRFRGRAEINQHGFDVRERLLFCDKEEKSVGQFHLR